MPSKKTGASRMAPALDRRWAIVLVALAWLLSGALWARAQSEPPTIDFGPRPDWVTRAELSEPRASRAASVRGGLYPLLVDTQVRIGAGDDRTVEYTRLAFKALNPSALEEIGRVSIRFDPSFARPILHSITVWRDGEPLDRLQPDAFEVVRQEPTLYDGEILGDLTAFVHLPDIRVGDVVDYEWSLVRDWPLWPGGFADIYWFNYNSEPVEERRVRLIAPADMPLSVESRRLPVEMTETRNGGSVTREWRSVDIPPLSMEDDTPSAYTERAIVAVSTMRNWGEVVDWARDVMAVDLALPEGALATALGGDGADLSRAEKITRVIRFVQDEIRYVGDEVGLGSHVPRSPKRVLTLGYGDCKDKSNLLIALLRALEVDAVPALTHSRGSAATPDQLPSPFLFNHVIVRIDDSDHVVWVDPTVTYQGGRFPKLATPDLSSALPLTAGQSAMETITAEKRLLASLSVEEEFDFKDLSGEGLALEVVATHRGREADEFRATLDSQSRDTLAERYLEYYRGLYPGIAVERPLSVVDNRDANFILTREVYRMPSAAFFRGDWRDGVPFRADAVLEKLPEVGSLDRRAPLALPYPLKRRHVHRLINTGYQFEPIDAVVETDVARYTARSVQSGNRFVIDYNLETLSPSVEKGAFEAHSRFLKDMGRTASVTYSFLDRSKAASVKNQADIQDASYAVAYAIREILDLTVGEDTVLDPDSIEAAFLAAFIIIYAALSYLSIRAHRSFRERSVFYPVSVSKFIILSVLTFGSYTFLWMWKNWLWARSQQGDRIWPFVRSVFSAFFVFPLGWRLQDRSDRRRPMVKYLNVFGLFIFGLSVVSEMLERSYALQFRVAAMFGRQLGPVDPSTLVAWCVEMAIVAMLVPYVVTINRLNDDADVMRAHSRWSYRSVLGALIGALVTFLALLA